MCICGISVLICKVTLCSSVPMETFTSRWKDWASDSGVTWQNRKNEV